MALFIAWAISDAYPNAGLDDDEVTNIVFERLCRWLGWRFRTRDRNTPLPTNWREHHPPGVIGLAHE